MNDILEQDEGAPETVCAFLDRAERTWPGSPAIRDVEAALTYRELAQSSRRAASWLRSRGVRHGDRVLLRHPNAARMAAFVLGAMHLGAVAVPVSPEMSLFQLRDVLADADAMVLICAEHEAQDLRSLSESQIISLAAAWDAALSHAPVDGPPLARPDDLSLLIYTSGSTASPKGVMCTHRQVSFAVRSIARRLRYQTDDAIFCRLPLSFDYGLYQLLLCLYAGAELQFPEPGNDPRLLRRIRDWQSTVVPVVPSLASMLISLAQRDRRPTRVRLFTNTGAALEPAAANALRGCFPGAKVSLMFGITECKRISILEADEDLTRPGSVGPPLDGTRVEVVDELGRPLPPGEIGQFVVSGPHVMQGYWRAPELTEQRFRPGPDGVTRALYTGDYGSVDAEGHLHFAGRRDDIFKHRGTRVSTLEIEAAAMDLREVYAAAALPPAGGRGPALFVVGDTTPVAVLAGLADRLERVKLPTFCRVLGELPLTVNGKVDKAVLAKLAAKEESGD